MQTPWTFEDWQSISESGNRLANQSIELNDLIGSGGGNVSTDDIRASINEIEATLARLKLSIANYN